MAIEGLSVTKSAGKRLLIIAQSLGIAAQCFKHHRAGASRIGVFRLQRQGLVKSTKAGIEFVCAVKRQAAIEQGGHIVRRSL